MKILQLGDIIKIYEVELWKEIEKNPEPLIKVIIFKYILERLVEER